MNKKNSQLAVAALFSLAAISANASDTITYNGFDYLLNVQRVTYTGNEAQIQSTPWWGNRDLAVALANIYKPSVAETQFVQFVYAPATFDPSYLAGRYTNKSAGFWESNDSFASMSTLSYFVFGTSVAAVPEADTSAMLLMGAGVMGFIAHRRRNTQA
jgi:hypothetical protein